MGYLYEACANKLCLKAGEINWEGKTKDSLKIKRIF
jgi:hypothetical protein